MSTSPLVSEVQSNVLLEDSVPPHTPNKNEDDLSDPEQALESHQVIELQAFSERKAWIEDKIKFLEGLAPIEPFGGLEAVRKSAEEFPELPTRQQLQEWIVEQETIEKETETFDSGDLTNLRKFTKAATQRHLSPQDTDLIELTLTTIYQLDKLLHLLRNRSDLLDLLAVRLSWEENRVQAWAERRNIVADVEAFLNARGRWSADAYFEPTIPEDDRRSSISSLASDSNPNLLPVLSRKVRFALAESLSKDAAQFTGRISNLKHVKIPAAGKALDKLIDNSRKPVPDELLDEQDRLEEGVIKEMESLPSFIEAAVTQWRKADEVYADTKKDELAIQTLMDEVTSASMQPPTSRLKAMFSSRMEALSTRLNFRNVIIHSRTIVSDPAHPLLPNQRLFNKNLEKKLSAEVTETSDLAQRAELLVAEYRQKYDALKDLETLSVEIDTVHAEFDQIKAYIISGNNLDGSSDAVPDLFSSTCLQPSAFAPFTAKLSTIIQRGQKTTAEAELIARKCRSATSAADHAKLDTSLKSKVVADVRKLVQRKAEITWLMDDVSARTRRLAEARKIWNEVERVWETLEDIRGDILQEINNTRWSTRRPDIESSQTLPHHTNSDTALKSLSTVTERLNALEQTTAAQVGQPLDSLARNLEDPLKLHLTEAKQGLEAELERTRNLAKLIEQLRAQNFAMAKVKDDVHTFQLRIEDLRTRLETIAETILHQTSSDSELPTDMVPTSSINKLKDEVKIFIDTLSSRLPFVSGINGTANEDEIPPVEARRSLDPMHLRTLRSGERNHGFAQELAKTDSLVRADANAYAISLSTEVLILDEYAENIKLATLAGQLSSSLNSSQHLLAEACLWINQQMNNLDKLNARSDEDCSAEYSTFLQNFEEGSGTHKDRIELSIHPMREWTHSMKQIRIKPRKAPYDSLQSSSENEFTLLQSSFDKWQRDSDSLRQGLLDARDADMSRSQKRLQYEDEERRAAEHHEQVDRVESPEARELPEVFEPVATMEQAVDDNSPEMNVLAEDPSNASVGNSDVALKTDPEQLPDSDKSDLVVINPESPPRDDNLKSGTESFESRDSSTLETLTSSDDISLPTLPHAARDSNKLVSGTDDNAAERDVTRNDEHKPADEHQDQTNVKASTDSQPRSQAVGQRLSSDESEIGSTRRTPLSAGSETSHETDDVEHRSSIETDSMTQPENLTNDENDTSVHRQNAIPKTVLKIAPAQRQKLAAANRKKTKANPQLKTVRESAVDGGPSTSHNTRPVNVVQQVQFPSLSKQGPETAPGDESLTHAWRKKVENLQTRLMALDLENIAYPATNSKSQQLPSRERAAKLEECADTIFEEYEDLKTSMKTSTASIDEHGLQIEVGLSQKRLQRISQLSDFSSSVHEADVAISALIDNVDSHPNQKSLQGSPSDGEILMESRERLASQLARTQITVADMTTKFAAVQEDPRAVAEKDRITQIWTELDDMCYEVIHGSRTPSSNGGLSGRTSVISTMSGLSGYSSISRRNGYSNLSVRSAATDNNYLSPSGTNVKSRSVSGDSFLSNKSASRLSLDSTKSSSNQIGANNSGNIKRPLGKVSRMLGSSQSTRLRADSSGAKILKSSPSLGNLHTRNGSVTSLLRGERSNTPSERSVSRSASISLSRSALSPARTSTSSLSSSWARAPRTALIPPAPSTPVKKDARKEYVANPKNRLDVAVGHVVNKMPVYINVVLVPDTWKDSSGKYWIGDVDPKLVFCRILRSQTVMVRVGGGWTELSKFIREHFAESFELSEMSPPRESSDNQSKPKWISSTFLREGRRDSDASSVAESMSPKDTTPQSPNVPQFTLSSPSGGSPLSHKTAGPSSPLVGLQYSRRSDAYDFTTPTKAKPRVSLTTPTPAKINVWRP